MASEDLRLKNNNFATQCRPAEASEKWQPYKYTTGFAQRHWQNKVRESSAKGRDLHALSWTPAGAGQRSYIFHVCVPKGHQPTLMELVALAKQRYKPWAQQRASRSQSVPCKASGTSLHRATHSSGSLSNYTQHDNPCAATNLTVRSMHGRSAFESSAAQAEARFTSRSTPYDESTGQLALAASQGGSNHSRSSSPVVVPSALLSCRSTPMPLAQHSLSASEVSAVQRSTQTSSRVGTGSQYSSCAGGVSEASTSLSGTPARASPSGMVKAHLTIDKQSSPKQPSLYRPSDMSVVGEEHTCWGSLSRSLTDSEPTPGARAGAGKGPGLRQYTVGQRCKQLARMLMRKCVCGAHPM